MRTVEAAIGAIRALLNGEVASATLPAFSLAEGQLTFRPPRPVPLALVAHGPVMYRMAGRLADIAFIANYALPEAIAWARAQLDRGRADRAVGAGGPREIWRVDVCVSADGPAAREVMRRRVRSLLARLGELVAVCGFTDICYRPYRAPGQTLPEATALVDDAVLSAIG